MAWWIPNNLAQTDSFNAKAFLRQLTSLPGVYRMLDEQDSILYVGKAKNLKNRVSSYFRSSGLSPKTSALVEKICRIEVTVTNSEAEALLLEQSLIKTQKPPYNILLRDDKSYPYIYRSAHPDYPSLTFRRVRHKKKDRGHYYGPYTSAASVRETLVFLQKVFRIRQCDDSFYANRSRPCLQHQIGRCSAPCVNLISEAAYQQDMQHTQMFLDGKKPELIQALIKEMERAASLLEFERAAVLRDQISYLRQIQEQQVIEGVSRDIDIFALATEAAEIFIHGLFVRDGIIIGTKTFNFRDVLENTASETLAAFLEQYYFGGHSIYGLPQELIVSHEIDDMESIRLAFQTAYKRNLRITSQVRTDRADWLKLACTNANQALRTHLQTEDALRSRWQQLCGAIGLPDARRVECFDISHTSGESTVASAVVFGPAGAIKDQYRRYNIQGITGGDDYAAMTQALTRHYERIKCSEQGLPDFVLIDGGLGQLKMAEQVFAAQNISQVKLLGVAKGVTRKPGFETLIRGGDHSVLDLPQDSAALHLIQQVRDEAHRFAITGHRKQRGRKRSQSILETLPGVGPKRRKDLLNYFGSLKDLERASVEEIKRVPGLSDVLASQIYAALHE
jgi:excinuclease ABC subunit C